MLIFMYIITFYIFLNDFINLFNFLCHELNLFPIFGSRVGLFLFFVGLCLRAACPSERNYVVLKKQPNNTINFLYHELNLFLIFGSLVGLFLFLIGLCLRGRVLQKEIMYFFF